MEREDTGKLMIVDNEDADDTCSTIVLHNEDHTLGNVLRHMLIKNKDVEFAGYSVPHPSENKINLRIQTYEKPCLTVLCKALDDTCKACDHILDVIDKAEKEFDEMD